MVEKVTRQMKTFYDFRDNDFKNPTKTPLQGRVILKNKKYWLCWICKDNSTVGVSQSLKGFVVAPRSIYLYNTYIATSFWNALKYFIKVSYGRKSN